MSNRRLGWLVSAGTVLALASTGLFALDATDPCPETCPAEMAAPVEQPEVVATEIDLQQELELAAAHWTHYGCIQLGSNCLDVYQDNKGNLWVCEACNTTQNPGPGHCRKLTAWEIANALWCA